MKFYGLIKSIFRGTVFSLAVIIILVTTFSGFAQKVEATGILPPNNPPANIAPNPDFYVSPDCSTGNVIDVTTACLIQTILAVDNARAQEGVAPMKLPTNYLSLTPAQELFVIANSERVDRGLPPIVGMTSQLNSSAQTGANDSTDPILPNGYNFTLSGSNWAGGINSVLGVNYAWMYQDGQGGFNGDCTATNTSGCWGHRDNILQSYDCNPCTMGAGTSLSPQPVNGTVYSPSYAEIFVGDTSGTSYFYTYTWSDVLSNMTPSPDVTGLSLSSSITTGGSTETISGSNLSNAVEVFFGSTAVTSITQVSSTEIQVVIPPNAAGSYDVRVVTLGGESAVVPNDLITYGNVPSPPTGVTATAGNSSVLVSFSPPTVTGVGPITGYVITPYLGSTAGTPVVITGNPPNPYGVVTGLVNGDTYTFVVAAENGAGLSSPSTASSPVVPTSSPTLEVLAVSPSSGPLSGNTPVEIYGSGFLGASRVNFGSVSAISVTVQSDSEVIAYSPVSSVAQSVDVTVVNSTTSPTVAADKFHYLSGVPYHPVTPFRLADTRVNSGYEDQGSMLQPNGTIQVNVTNMDGVPSSATAAVFIVTATNTTSYGGYLTVYPGGSLPPVSNLNWSQNETVAALVTVQLSSSGTISITNGPMGSCDVIVDLQGYYAPNSTFSNAGGYTAIQPARLVDTRDSSGKYQDPGMTLNQGGTDTFQVEGYGGVPLSGVEAVVLEVTATNTTANGGYFTVWPGGGSSPVASDLNWSSGQTVANRVIAKLSSSGSVSVYNAVGSADLVVDVVGWYDDGTVSSDTGGYFNAIDPIRIADTRPGYPYQLSGNTLGAALPVSVTVAGQGTQNDGVPSLVSSTPPIAVVLNVTAVNTSSWSYFTVWPQGSTVPYTSDVNWSGPNEVVSNECIDLLGNGQISIQNAIGTTDLVVDVFGWFS